MGGFCFIGHYNSIVGTQIDCLSMSLNGPKKVRPTTTH